MRKNSCLTTIFHRYKTKQAFQCRRCRHINYERLDAFLCVECGYCANGSFTYEIKGIGASKAVSILDDEDVIRSILQLKSSRRIASSTYRLLSQKVAAIKLEKESGDDIHFQQFLEKYDKPLSNALTGRMPNFYQGHIECDQGNSNASLRTIDVSERVRSLLSLARPARSATADISNQESNRVELLFRQALLSSRLLSDTMDPSDDFTSEYATRNIRHFGMDDSRVNGSDRSTQDFTSDLLARILRRASDREHSNLIVGVTDEAVAAEVKKKPKSQASHEENIEEMKKLFHLYREALSDCHDINRKLAAWTRMNRSGLMGFNNYDSNPVIKNAYIPTTCPHCSPILSYELLLLLKTLFTTRFKDTREILDTSFIASLFDFSDDSNSDLSDLKRSMIVTLASESSISSEMILDILKSRLSTRDAICADILGKIIAKSSSQAFLRLALDTLDML